MPDYLINPSIELLMKFLHDLNVQANSDIDQQGLLRFVYAKTGTVIFANALNYYHSDLRKIIKQEDNNLEGFLTGDRTLQIRIETAQNYFNKPNPTTEDILGTTFCKEFELIIKSVEFLS